MRELEQCEAERVKGSARKSADDVMKDITRSRNARRVSHSWKTLDCAPREEHEGVMQDTQSPIARGEHEGDAAEEPTRMEPA